jgi:hypothetical protein
LKTRTILSIALPILAAACGYIQPNRVTPIPTPLPTAVYRVDIQAESSSLAIGATATGIGTVVGSFSNPVYYLKVEDLNPAPSEWEITLTPDGGVHEMTGRSNILELVSADSKGNRVTAVFRARRSGVTAVRIGINGEIVETDETGHSFFNYVSKFSGSLRIEVF